MGISNLLPARSDIAPPDRTVVLDLTSEEADDIFSVLSSTTARSILSTLHEEPQPASQLASNLDLTLQNVNDHVQKLLEAELIEVADLWYSDTGNEMKVYAPSKKAVMVLADQSMTRRLRDMVLRAFSVALLIGSAAALFRFGLVDRFVTGPGPDEERAAAGDQPATDDAADVDDAPDDLALETTDTFIDREITIEEALEALPFLLDPGVVFLLGALVALVVVGGIWVIRRYRHGIR